MQQRDSNTMRLSSSTLLSAMLLVAQVTAFSTTTSTTSSSSSSFLAAPPTVKRAPPAATFHVQRPSLILLRALKNDNKEEEEDTFNPLHITNKEAWESTERTLQNPISASSSSDDSSWLPTTTALATLSTLPLVLSSPDSAIAKTIQIPKSLMLENNFDPDSFKPVCPASDSFYRVLQGTAYTVVGEENFVEYGPIIASGLLRIRLELCVVESFFNEAVGPFIKQNGLGWVLPLHETVETFLAGTIFALATTFILVGSTKLITVILTYTDVFVGAPCRIFGSFLLDRSKGKPVTLDIGFGPWKKRVVGPSDEEMESSKKEKQKGDGEKEKEDIAQILDLEGVPLSNLPFVFASGSLKYAGEASKILKEFMESLDLFVGRYLTLLATGYIGLKFIHFKVFPDFPPF